MAIPAGFIVIVGVPGFVGIVWVSILAGFLIIFAWALAGILSVLDDPIPVDPARESCRQEVGFPLAPFVSPPSLKIDALVQPVSSSRAAAHH